MSVGPPHRHLADFLQQHGHALVVLFFGLLLPLLSFVKIAQEVFENEPFAFEKPLMLAIHAHSSGVLNDLAVAFSLFGSAKGMAPLGLILVALLYRMRRRLGYFMALSLGGVAITNVLLKDLFDRPRPAFWTPVLPEPDFSFPSGHAMFASALASAAVAILWPTRWRVPALILGILYVLAMMGSRVYIGVHYPTDVTGGALFSLAWVFGLAQILHIHRLRPGLTAPTTALTDPVDERGARV